jgi:methionine-rich copper-binding protein CopC
MPRRRAVLALVLLSLAPALAQAHAALTDAAPSADSVAQGAPTVVELTFSDNVQPKSGRIMVKSADGRRVDANDVHAVSDARHLAVSLKTMLPGHYVVTWKATGADAAPLAGSYGFTVGQ